jgi:hypothetical protein
VGRRNRRAAAAVGVTQPVRRRRTERVVAQEAEAVAPVW